MVRSKYPCFNYATFWVILGLGVSFLQHFVSIMRRFMRREGGI